MVTTMTWLTLTEYLFDKDHGHAPFVVITIRSFPHSRLITRFVISITMGATCGARTAFPSGVPEFIPVFSGVRIVPSLVFCAVFCRLLYIILQFTASGFPFGIFKLFVEKPEGPFKNRQLREKGNI